MASCQITIAGTSGEVEIRYKILGSDIFTNAFFNSIIYIDTTATNITYTTLSGDATCSSGCVTITALPLNYYLFQWETFKLNNPLFLGAPVVPTSYDISMHKFILGATVTNMANTAMFNTDNWRKFADEITALNNINLEIISGKRENSTRNTVNTFFILKVLGTDLPSIEFKNVNVGRDDFFLTLKGKSIVSPALPGFEAYDPLILL